MAIRAKLEGCCCILHKKVMKRISTFLVGAFVFSGSMFGQCVMTNGLQSAIASHPENYCSDPTHQGYTYNTVSIGGQCWFAENLRVDQFNNGDAIPERISNGDFYGAEAPARYTPGGDFLSTRGRLYNWYVVDDARGVCPTGWHVPSDEEWMELEGSLGMSVSDQNGWGNRGTGIADKMKSSASDVPSWNGNNSSGFSGLTTGWRTPWNGNYASESSYGYYWSSTYYVDGAMYRRLSDGLNKVHRENDSERAGMTIRCVKD
jgi:uncharacterized protein (TIGR02145 family)